MNIHDINGLWAIRPEAGEALQHSLERFIESATPEQMAAFFLSRAKPSAPEPLPYAVRGDGVAVLQIEGALSKRPSFWGDGVTYEQVVAGVQKAQADSAVRSIILAWDSPGGTVDGAQEASDALFAMRQTGKPMESVAVGQMTSAAEMVGSAAGPVWASSDTTDMGSIGVLAIHRDFSGMEEKWGIKTTLLTAGKYKGVGFGPLNAEAKAILQEGLDHSYDVFKKTVARNRGISMDAVERMAEGRVFKGQQAVQVGLASGIATVSSRVAALSKRLPTASHRGALQAIAEPNNNTQQEKKRMTKEELLAQHPELAAAFREEGRAEGIQAGADSERTRIKTVMALRRPGHEALVEGMAYDGKSTAGDVAVAILDAQEKARTKKAEDLAADTPKVVPTASKPSEADEKEQAGKPSGVEIAAKIRTTIQEHASKGVTITPQEALQIIRKEG